MNTVKNVIPRLSLIAAYDRNRAIGRAGTIPWAVPEDMLRFVTLTKGCPVIMGRKTWDSLPGILLGRHNIVLSSSPIRLHGMTMNGTKLSNPTSLTTARDLDEALDVAGMMAPGSETFVIGGQGVYEAAMPMAGRMYLTEVNTATEGADTWFPAFSDLDWKCDTRSGEWRPSSRRDTPDFRFETYSRKAV